MVDGDEHTPCAAAYRIECFSRVVISLFFSDPCPCTSCEAARRQRTKRKRAEASEAVLQLSPRGSPHAAARALRLRM